MPFRIHYWGIIFFSVLLSIDLRADEDFANALKLLNSSKIEQCQKGLQIIKALGDNNNPKALLALADLYLEGRLLERNQRIAFELTERAAKLNLPEALNNLGVFHEKGIGTPMNLSLAYESYDKSSKLLFVPAIYNMAVCYDKGIGTSRNIVDAVELYIKAANKSHLQSQVRLGQLYKKTQPYESTYWYRLAADQGDSEALFEVAKAHLNGLGANQDYEAAFNYFLKAANKNHNDSMFEVGSLYMRGLGTEKNLMKAGRWILLSKSRKNARASKFSQKDFVYKFDLLIEIERASNGNITSLENLGWNYFSGKHIGIDRVESYAWFNLAAVSSDDKPILWAKSYVANHLSVDELIKAKLRAKQISSIYRFKKPSEPTRLH
tara:strand:- start:754 stop:1890 length:1137 start_codon:yes stop_codon:yes gene_type:complete